LLLAKNKATSFRPQAKTKAASFWSLATGWLVQKKIRIKLINAAGKLRGR
jgi:hypothetical protein